MKIAMNGWRNNAITITPNSSIGIPPNNQAILHARRQLGRLWTAYAIAEGGQYPRRMGRTRGHTAANTLPPDPTI